MIFVIGISEATRTDGLCYLPKSYEIFRDDAGGANPQPVLKVRLALRHHADF